MSPARQWNNSGFTLAELIVSLAIILMVLAVVSHLFFSGQKQQTEQINAIEIEQNIHNGLEKIIADIEQSSMVTYIEASQGLRLYTYIANQSGNGYNWQTVAYTLERDPQGNAHIHQLEGKVLYRKVSGGEKRPIANFLDAMEVEYWDKSGNPVEQPKDVVGITITLSTSTENGGQRMTRSASLGMDNFLAIGGLGIE